MENKKDNRGGARQGAGRPKVKERKEQVPIYVLPSVIKKIGGKQKIKGICYIAIKKEISDQKKF